jgi:hypothetical protein
MVRTQRAVVRVMAVGSATDPGEYLQGQSRDLTN